MFNQFFSAPLQPARRRSGLCGLILLLCLAGNAFAQTDPDGAIAALRAIPRSYQNGVMKLSADNARVNPRTWYIVAHNEDDVPRNFTVSRGQVVDDSSGLAQNLRSIFTGAKSINLSKVNVDSAGAWAAAQKYAAAKGENLGTVSYVLQQKGRSAAPIWSVWAYEKNGAYIGYLELLATSGEVISSDF